MSINATTSSTSQVSSTQSTAQTSSASNSDSAKKTSSESSFKDEMNKVDSSKETKETKETSETNNQNKKVEDGTKDKNSDNSNDLSQSNNPNQNANQNLLEGGVDYSNFASMSMLNANNNLTDDIQQVFNINAITTSEVTSKSSVSFGFDDTSATNTISMTESDADFFINLTQNNDISMQNVTTQAQNLLNNGAEVSNVKQNVQVSQALLDALSNARETNQPLRIDFDQNVSVILRIGKDGSFAANFIPGDKAVEQYLKSNIDSLKATFRENDLPYSDLSYSSRGKQQQKENRRNKQ